MRITRLHTVFDEGAVVGPAWWFSTVIACFLVGLVMTIIILADRAIEPAIRYRNAGWLFAIVTIPFALTMVQVFRLRRALGEATLLLPHPSLPLGFSGSAIYERPMRNGARVREIHARVQCLEQLVKGRGRTERAFKATALDEPATTVITAETGEMDVTVTFRIPETGPATFDEDGMTLRWVLRLELLMEGCPNTQSLFELKVLPAVVRR
jgi:hypothetical protein